MARVDEIIAERGWKPLNDTTSRVLCAVDENNTLVGFHVLQLFPHVEPLWVDPAYRGSSLASDLASKMFDFMMSVNARGFMVIADSPHAEELCKAHGMKRVIKPVYVY